MDVLPAEDATVQIPLTQVPAGERVMVTHLGGGRGLALRLADLGILPGAILDVVHGGVGGPMILSLRGNRLAVGRGIARRVMVKRCGE